MSWLEWLVFVIACAATVLGIHFFGWTLVLSAIGICLFVLAVITASQRP